jgi:integrase
MKTSSLSTTEGLSRAEAENLLRCCAADPGPAGVRDLALLLVLIMNGLRRAELVSLDVDGFRFIDDTPVYVITGKGDKKRTMEFVPDVWEAVVRWVELVNDDTGPLFRRLGRPGKKGQKITPRRLTTNGVYHIIKRRTAEAGIQKSISPHSLRHTYATLALLAKVPIQEVQISMGHTSPDTTFRYFRALEQVGRSPTRAIKLSWQQDEKEEQP